MVIPEWSEQPYRERKPSLTTHSAAAALESSWNFILPKVLLGFPYEPHDAGVPHPVFCKVSVTRCHYLAAALNPEMVRQMPRRSTVAMYK